MTRVLGIVLARGGSVRLPGKNIRPLGGIPLISWTIRVALKARLDRLILSTDCEEIAEVGRREGAEVPFIRPPALATSEATSLDAVLHALDAVGGAEIAVLLQPTSPFRRVHDIDAVLALVEAGAPAAVSTCRLPFKWNTMLAVSESGVALHPTVSVEPTHRLNGAVYGIQADVLRSEKRFVPGGTRIHEMPPALSVDIDTIDDFNDAEAVVSSGLVTPVRCLAE